MGLHCLCCCPSKNLWHHTITKTIGHGPCFAVFLLRASKYQISSKYKIQGLMSLEKLNKSNQCECGSSRKENLKRHLQEADRCNRAEEEGRMVSETCAVIPLSCLVLLPKSTSIPPYAVFFLIHSRIRVSLENCVIELCRP